MTRAALLLSLFAFTSGFASDDLEAAKKETSPDRRQRRALDLMDASFHQAQDALRENSPPDKVQALLDQMADAAEYSLAALRETGQKPGKMTKQYKRGDLRTRELIRKLESFINAMAYGDRPAAVKTKVRIQVVAEEYLLGAMSRK
ncbi:MAG: hypothetical protein IT161_08120 [Bryobacterales bacterium]|nr:hypothetical protein [Bryobacterales bacterium]